MTVYPNGVHKQNIRHGERFVKQPLAAMRAALTAVEGSIRLQLLHFSLIVYFIDTGLLARLKLPTWQMPHRRDSAK